MAKKQINFRNTELLKVFTNIKEKPDNGLPLLALLGRSNVGKSSLINVLCGQKSLARVSSTPGKTRLILYYLIDGAINLVDLPGYGYSATGRGRRELFSSFTDQFMRSTVDDEVLFLLLIDIRRKFNADDVAMAQWLEDHELNYMIVFTKCDKLSQKEAHKSVKKNLELFEFEPDYVLTSASKRKGIQELRRKIAGFAGCEAQKND